MTFRVRVTQRAKNDLRFAHGRAAKHAPMTADRWLDRFEKALATLADDPQRFPLAPENDLVGPEIREFLFGKRRNVYRALFTIQGNIVRVLHIRSASQDWAAPEDLLE